MSINDTLRVEFSYRDPMGNLRISFRDSLASATDGIYPTPVMTQIAQSDPWGLPLRGLEFENTTASSKFKFLNRETQAETGWIDLMARQYDAQLGVFRMVDPVIEGQEHLSLYQYGWNNPVLMSDPNGNCPFCPIIPYLPAIGAAVGESLAILAEATVVSGVIIGLTDLVKSSGSGAGGAYSPAVGLAMSTSRPGELTTMLNSSSRNQGRGSAGAANKKKGDDFEKKVSQKLKDEGHDDVAEQVTIRPNPDPNGKQPKKVKLDNVSKKDNEIKLTDAKSSDKAPLTKNQEEGYPLIEKNGGTVVGKKSAAKGYPEGTKIPPTKVDIILIQSYCVVIFK